MPRRFMFLAPLAAAALGACNPTLQSHGFRFSDGEPPEIVPGEDTEASVLASLGNPSTRGTFEDNAWYYVSATREQLAYLRPETRDRRIVAVRFNDQGIVEAVEEYSLADGRQVRFTGRETPTRGRELSLLEQLLGSVGRLPTEQFGGEQNLPGGAGGPREDGGR